MPVFKGADRVLKLIGALYQRPRFGDRPRKLQENDDGQWGELIDRQDRIGRKGLPMVCLVRPDGQEDLLPAINTYLQTAKPRGIRHAYIRRTDDSSTNTRTQSDPLDADDVITITNLLREARNSLVNCRKVGDSRLRFGLFTLVLFLMNQRLDPEDANQERTLLRNIQELGLNQRFRKAVQNVEEKVPNDKFWWRLPFEAALLTTLGLFRIAVTGRLPIISGQYRWFMLQPHLAPEMSGSFVRFAQRLTQGQWTEEAPEYVARLLVNSFLEDLRRAYRLRPWQVWRKRRMTYPVLLLDNITMSTANGGYVVLRLINDVRNQVGRFDPLLVISASRDVFISQVRRPATVSAGRGRKSGTSTATRSDIGRHSRCGGPRARPGSAFPPWWRCWWRPSWCSTPTMCGTATVAPAIRR